MTIAFLTVSAAAARDHTSEKPSLPVFKPRFWYRNDRLDARPVAWSLRNRPDDWEWGDTRHCTVRHKPSRHEFWVASGRGFYRLFSANCGCSSTDGHFQRFQQGVFGRAFRRWCRTARPTYDPQEFAGHFVR